MADSCSYNFDPSDYDFDLELDEELSCPHAPYEEEDRCIFHLTIEEREEMGIDNVQDEFLDVVNSEDKGNIFLGAHFENMDLTYEHLETPKNHPIVIVCCNIEGELMLKNATVDPQFYLDGSEIGTVNAVGTEFSSDFYFENGSLAYGNFKKAEFGREANFESAEIENGSFDRAVFQDGAGFDNCISREGLSFEDIESNSAISLSNVDTESLNLSDSIIRDALIVNDTECRELRLDDAEMESAIFNESQIGSGRFDRTKFQKAVDFKGSEFDLFSANRAEFNSATTFENAEIDDSEFHHIDFEEVHFKKTEFHEDVEFSWANIEIGQFSGTKFTDISFKNSEIKVLYFSPKPTHRKLVAKFDTTEIKKGNINYALDEDDEKSEEREGTVEYRFTSSTLGDVYIESFGNTNPFYYVSFEDTSFDGFDFSYHRPYLSHINYNLNIGINSELDIHKLATLYLKAKNGASKSGDSKVESEFFLREMDCRRKIIQKKILDSSTSIIDRAIFSWRYLAYSALKLLSAYGEKPRRVVAWSFSTVVLCAFLYPLVGGLEGEDTIVSYPVMTSVSDIEPFLHSLKNSLYFSLVTFTTLGSDSYSPLNSFARLLEAFESFTGAFLIALFVFTLGRQVAR